MLVEFVLMTMAVMLGVLLASGVAFAVMFNKKVLKWYMHKSMEIVEEIQDEI